MMTPNSLKRPQKNHSVTAPSAQVLLGSESLQYQENNTTRRPGQKLPPPGKEYLSFQIEGGSTHAEQCVK